MSIFSKRLRSLMLKNQVSGKVLSLSTGIPESTLSEWLNGRTPKFNEQLLQLTEYFKVSLDELICERSDSPVSQILHPDLVAQWSGSQGTYCLKFDGSLRIAPCEELCSQAGGDSSSLLFRAIDLMDSGLLVFRAARSPEGDVEDFVFDSCNRLAESLLGLNRKNLLGKSLNRDLRSLRNLLFGPFLQAVSTLRPVSLEHFTVDSRWIGIECQYFQEGVLARLRDVTASKQNEDATLRDREYLENLKVALDKHAIVASTDPSGKITYANDMFCEISGYSRSELLGKNHRILNSGHHSRAFFAEMWATISAGRVWKGEIKNRAKDGSCYWVSSTIVPLMNGKGRPIQYLSIRSDITAIKEREESLEEMRALLNAEVLKQSERLEALSRDLDEEIHRRLKSERRIISSVLKMAFDRGESTEVNVRKVVSEVIDELRSVFPEGMAGICLDGVPEESSIIARSERIRIGVFAVMSAIMPARPLSIRADLTSDTLSFHFSLQEKRSEVDEEFSMLSESIRGLKGRLETRPRECSGDGIDHGSDEVVLAFALH